MCTVTATDIDAFLLLSIQHMRATGPHPRATMIHSTYLEACVEVVALWTVSRKAEEEAEGSVVGVVHAVVAFVKAIDRSTYSWSGRCYAVQPSRILRSRIAFWPHEIQYVHSIAISPGRSTLSCSGMSNGSAIEYGSFLEVPLIVPLKYLVSTV